MCVVTQRTGVYVVAFMVVFLLMCAPSKEEKLAAALREVERLDEMRKKTREIVVEQELNFIREGREYSDWEKLESELLHWRNVDVEFAKRKLEGLKGSGHEKEIAHWKTELENAKDVYQRQKAERDRLRAIKVQNLAKMRTDLVLSTAAYDSINALHTKAVTDLSKEKE